MIICSSLLNILGLISKMINYSILRFPRISEYIKYTRRFVKIFHYTFLTIYEEININVRNYESNKCDISY